MTPLGSLGGRDAGVVPAGNDRGWVLAQFCPLPHK